VEELVLLGPETRQSLIVQLRDPTARRAWEEFVQLYQAVVYRVARSRGLQDADAEDLTQEVLMTVARKVEDFDFSKAGSFRGWLLKITRDLVVNKLTRETKAIGSGDSEVLQLMNQHPDREATCTLLLFEHRRALLAQAATRLRPTIRGETWDAFWLTAVEGLSISEAAARLNKSEGAIRVARCRVLAQLKKVIESDDSTFSL
jgi:RNA polymerase sigma-70 factor (ECF subfamily)